MTNPTDTDPRVEAITRSLSKGTLPMPDLVERWPATAAWAVEILVAADAVDPLRATPRPEPTVAPHASVEVVAGEPSGAAGADPAWTALVLASIQWAVHMGQWEMFQFETARGPVYVSMKREVDDPGAYLPVRPGHTQGILADATPIPTAVLRADAEYKVRAVGDHEALVQVTERVAALEAAIDGAGQCVSIQDRLVGLQNDFAGCWERFCTTLSRVEALERSGWTAEKEIIFRKVAAHFGLGDGKEVSLNDARQAANVAFQADTPAWPDRRCGTCLFSAPDSGRDYLNCVPPLPWWISRTATQVHPHDGARCLAWAKREEEDGK